MRSSHHPKKSLGQNFLIDKNIIKKIIKIGELNHNSIVIEIGPGKGNLTKEIIHQQPKKIILIEKDTNLTIFLKKFYENYPNLNIINTDILNFINDKILHRNIIVFGNLPYNISTQILAKLITLNKWPPWYNKLILMFQKEVADRIIAKDKAGELNRLAVLSNWRLDITKHFDISKNCFFPKPKINSTILSFIPKKNTEFDIKNPKNIEIVTRALFSNPRKMINKNLLKLFKNDISVIKKLDINLNQRPGKLSYEMFYKITAKYEKLFK